MNTLTTLFKNNIRDYGMLIALIAVMVFFQVQTNGVLFKPVNITNLVLQNSYVITMALGMLLIIITGWIDLSVGSVVAVVGALAGVLIVEGIGLSLLPAEIVEPEVRAGTLRIVGARPAIPDFPMFVAYRRDASSANVRNFIARIRASVAVPARPAIARGGRNMIRKTNADRKKNKL
jgi:ribose/xylose/arabinose/galactoside ABC-type transport system permease subunit